MTLIPPEKRTMELSVVIPCLNEVETVGICVSKALKAIQDHQIQGEVIVADNGSTDGSIAVSEKLGARVVPVTEKGYGNALMGGIAEANGRYIIMGDADDSYDFLEIPHFTEELRKGYNLVMGCRRPAGGGTILPGAMPFLHCYLGNPLFSWMARIMFHSPIHDIYCGLRGFSADLYQRLNMTCTGMEFATEMVIKSSLLREKITEIPITLHPDGRKTRAPHLKTFRDGWRTLRFFLLFSPTWLFLIPGLFLIFLGLLGYGIIYPGNHLFGAHSLLFCTLSIFMGYQSLLFLFFSKGLLIGGNFLQGRSWVHSFFSIFTLEKGLLASAGMMGLGIALLLYSFLYWARLDFGPLNYEYTMRLVIPGFLFTALGYQSMMASFFISMLGIKKR